jgi:hypothetical protein
MNPLRAFKTPPMRIALTVVASVALWAWLAPWPALAEPDVTGGAGGDVVWVAAVEASRQSGGSDLASSRGTDTEHPTPYVAYRWLSVCAPSGAVERGAPYVECSAARSCADPVDRAWRLWGQRDDRDWDPLYTQCFGRPPTVADTPRPTVTPALVLQALRRIGLPALEAQTQPEDKTLVNFDTIFYAEASTFTRTLRLLGQRVEVEAQPSRYTWQHGDGTAATTSTPGAPYPAKDIVHQYTDAHRTVQTRVDVTYTARFRVNGGAWQDIAETVTITGPATALRIAEATAVLSGSYE